MKTRQVQESSPLCVTSVRKKELKGTLVKMRKDQKLEVVVQVLLDSNSVCEPFWLKPFLFKRCVERARLPKVTLSVVCTLRPRQPDHHGPQGVVSDGAPCKWMGEGVAGSSPSFSAVASGKEESDEGGARESQSTWRTMEETRAARRFSSHSKQL